MAHGPAHDAVLTAYSQSLIKKLAQELSGKPGFTRSDREDLQQELTLFLLAKAPLFDPKRGSPNTFAKQVIQSGYFTVLRNRGRLKRSAGFRALSLEQTSASKDKETTMLRDLIEGSDLERRTGAVGDCASRAEQIAAIAEAFRSLSPRDQEICRRLTEGTVAATARDMGISRRQVRNVMERVRKRFEALGLGDS